jgi:hypothetical protein
MPERPAGIAVPAGDRTLEILVVPARIGLHHVVRVLGRDDLHDRNIAFPQSRNDIRGRLSLLKLGALIKTRPLCSRRRSTSSPPS